MPLPLNSSLLAGALVLSIAGASIAVVAFLAALGILLEFVRFIVAGLSE